MYKLFRYIVLILCIAASHSLLSQESSSKPIAVNLLRWAPLLDSIEYRAIMDGISYYEYWQPLTYQRQYIEDYPDTLVGSTPGTFLLPPVYDWLESTSDKRIEKSISIVSQPILIVDFHKPDTTIKSMGFVSLRGHAKEIGGKYSAISTYRLKHEYKNRKDYLMQLSKVARHEFGHLFGLEHCNQEKCIMQTGFKFKEAGMELCDSCQVKFKNWLKYYLH